VRECHPVNIATSFLRREVVLRKIKLVHAYRRVRTHWAYPLCFRRRRQHDMTVMRVSVKRENASQTVPDSRHCVMLTSQNLA
jgi:hypothetical protein